MRQLILPTTHLHASWLIARDEWGQGAHQPGAALWRAAGCDLDSPEGFAAWVARLHQDADSSVSLPDTLVHATTWWIVDGEYLGSIQLRHTLNDHLLDSGGHVGYGIRPSARRQGHATWALGAVRGVRLQAAPQPHGRGVPVRLTCVDGHGEAVVAVGTGRTDAGDRGGSTRGDNCTRTLGVGAGNEGDHQQSPGSVGSWASLLARMSRFPPRSRVAGQASRR